MNYNAMKKLKHIKVKGVKKPKKSMPNELLEETPLSNVEKVIDLFNLKKTALTLEIFNQIKDRFGDETAWKVCLQVLKDGFLGGVDSISMEESYSKLMVEMVNNGGSEKFKEDKELLAILFLLSFDYWFPIDHLAKKAWNKMFRKFGIINWSKKKRVLWGLNNLDVVKRIIRKDTKDERRLKRVAALTLGHMISVSTLYKERLKETEELLQILKELSFDKNRDVKREVVKAIDIIFSGMKKEELEKHEDLLSMLDRLVFDEIGVEERAGKAMATVLRKIEKKELEKYKQWIGLMALWSFGHWKYSKRKIKKAWNKIKPKLGNKKPIEWASDNVDTIKQVIERIDKNKNKSEYTRVAIIKAISVLKLNELKYILEREAASESDYIKAMAYTGLYLLGDKNVFEEIEKMSFSEYALSREDAVKAIGEILSEINREELDIYKDLLAILLLNSFDFPWSFPSIEAKRAWNKIFRWFGMIHWLRNRRISWALNNLDLIKKIFNEKVRGKKIEKVLATEVMSRVLKKLNKKDVEKVKDLIPVLKELVNKENWTIGTSAGEGLAAILNKMDEKELKNYREILVMLYLQSFESPSLLWEFSRNIFPVSWALNNLDIVKKFIKEALKNRDKTKTLIVEGDNGTILFPPFNTKEINTELAAIGAIEEILTFSRLNKEKWAEARELLQYLKEWSLDGNPFARVRVTKAVTNILIGGISFGKLDDYKDLLEILKILTFDRNPEFRAGSLKFLEKVLAGMSKEELKKYKDLLAIPAILCFDEAKRKGEPPVKQQAMEIWNMIMEKMEPADWIKQNLSVVVPILKELMNNESEELRKIGERVIKEVKIEES